MVNPHAEIMSNALPFIVGSDSQCKFTPRKLQRSMRQFCTIALAIFMAGGGSPTQLYAQGSSNADDCAGKLTVFVKELDELLLQRPRDLMVVTGFLQRHIPVRSCSVDAASDVMKTSAYFKGEERVRQAIQFSFSNATSSSRGATILLVLHDTGNWDPPFAIWYPLYP